MTQLSRDGDKRLDALSRRIGKLQRIQARAEELYDKAWEEVIENLAEFNKVRFASEDGATLALEKRTGKPTLNEALLEQLLRKELGDDFTTLWNEITNRKVDPEKLEVAVHSGRIPHSVMEEVLQPGHETYARVRKPWTKADRQLIDDGNR